MFDIMDAFKSLNISIGTVMKDSEISKLVPNNFKIKKMCSHAVKKLPYLLRYVADQYKTQKLYEEGTAWQA